jgi:hypothetical protein
LSELGTIITPPTSQLAIPLCFRYSPLAQIYVYGTGFIPFFTWLVVSTLTTFCFLSYRRWSNQRYCEWKTFEQRVSVSLEVRTHSRNMSVSVWMVWSVAVNSLSRLRTGLAPWRVAYCLLHCFAPADEPSGECKAAAQLKDHMRILTYTATVLWGVSHNCQIELPWPESASELYRPSEIGEVSARFCPLFGQRDGSPLQYFRISRLGPLFFLPSSSSIVLTRLSAPSSRPTTSQKIL